ncbi:MAG: hypothetical protein LUH19_03785 [Lachnospiraceae bacterium]|nr:hypothetical protein [Lachnospiraceae bacterium]
MGDPQNDFLQRQKNEQSFQIRQELEVMQNWDMEEGQTLEERRKQEANRLIERQRELNQQLSAKAGSMLQPARAQAASAGQPLQEQAAAKKSYKQRREESRRTKEAQKHHPMADYVSYSMAKQLGDLKAGQLLTMNPERTQRAVEAQVDQRVLGVFMQGYRVNKKGLPASRDDAIRKEEDERFFEDYLSKDLTRRQPHLERLTNEIINAKITPQMFNEEYLEKHTGEIKMLSERLTYLKNVMQDPINQPYFDSLPQYQKDLIREKREMSTQLATMLFTAGAVKGISINQNGYSNQPPIEIPYDVTRNIFNQECERYQEQERLIYDQRVDEEMELEIPGLLQRSEQIRQNAEQSPLTNGLNMTSFSMEDSYEQLGYLRQAIEENPEYYQANKAMLDDLYQQAYRAIDSVGDRKLKLMAIRQVCDNYDGSLFPQDMMKFERASEKRKAYEEEFSILNEQVQAHINAAAFFLKDEPLSENARDILIRCGYTRELTRKRFTGADGIVGQSNEAYHNALERDGFDELEARSYALQGLGIRTSTSEAAALNRLIIQDTMGDYFAKIGEEYRDYFHQLEDVRHMNMNQVLTDKEKVQYGNGAYNYGGDIDEISDQIMTMFLNRLTSPATVSYFREMLPNVQDADIFDGKQEDAAAFLAQNLMTIYGANTTAIYRENSAGGYKDRENIHTVAVEACRTVLCVCGMQGAISLEKEAELPAQIQALLNRYRQGIRELMGKLAG